MTSIVKFEGLWGVGEETPHCYLLTIDNFTFLLDCGWDEKFDKNFIDRLTKVIPIIDCVLLSYPDALHMGALPYLIGKGLLSCPVLATIPVYKMGQMFMYDWYQSHHNYDEFDAFTLDNVDSAFDAITQIKYNQNIPMRGAGLGLSVCAQPAGHMIGGSIWRISREGEEEIVYAVDFNHKKERHLMGCDIDQISRPSLLITDAFNASYRQERRRQRDEKFFSRIQETCRAGGNVLVATDTAGRLLELAHMLEQIWTAKDSGIQAYTLAILSNTSYHVVHFARQMIEWMSEKLIKTFDSQRLNPFSLKYVKFCHNITDLSRLASPQVVLCSFPDLECGFSRELFIQWATNPKNTIILTQRTAPGTLARLLIDSPEVQTFRLVQKRRVKLEGDELDDFMKLRMKEHKVKIKEELLIDSDESDAEDEITLLEPGQHDIVLLEETPGAQGLLRSKKHHPMYPYIEEKTRGDEYGEYFEMDPSAMDVDDKDENSAAKPAFRTPFFDEDIQELDDAPTKSESETVTVRLQAQVHFIDFEGRSDGESILKIMEAVHPLRVILVRGEPSVLSSYGQRLHALTMAKVFTPKLGEIVDASMESHIYQVRLSESLVASLLLQPTKISKNVEVAWMQGKLTYFKENVLDEDDVHIETVETARDSDIPTLKLLPLEEAPHHDPVYINDMKLSDFKQVLSKEGISSEFIAGILWCANGTVALKRHETGSISMEGSLSEEYFQIRELLYGEYAIV